MVVVVFVVVLLVTILVVVVVVVGGALRVLLNDGSEVCLANAGDEGREVFLGLLTGDFLEGDDEGDKLGSVSII